MLLHEPKLSTREFEKFRKLIYGLSGLSLADSKIVMVQGRLAKRLRALGLESYSDYWDMLDKSPRGDEITKFINALTTNKTDFFRESHHFDFLMKTVFPQIKKRADETGDRKVRIWCSASSTGEEPYTIGMTLLEFFGVNSSWDIRVLASDIDTDVLKTASDGIYNEERVSDIPDLMRRKYFDVANEGMFRAKSFLRELITFRQINLQDESWPIRTQFDVIFCRNVMIYFDQPSQSKIVNHFSKYLPKDGYLIIGHSESLFGLTEAYKSIGETVYQVKEGGKSAVAKAVSPAATRVGPVKTSSEAHARETIKPAIPSALKVNSFTSAMDATDELDALPKHPIIVGEVYASREPVWITTLLGSCIATCMYDEVAGVGGMNHFMLPDSELNSIACASYGVHSMEMLINEIMRLGGRRSRLKAKVFGGCKIVRSCNAAWNIGQKNIEFAKHFLDTERIPVVASHTGGETGMNVKFQSQSAKVLVRILDSVASKTIDQQQKDQARKQVSAALSHEDITLF